jgi:pimeloyl-ACP methyl ester carboxylesterase
MLRTQRVLARVNLTARPSRLAVALGWLLCAGMVLAGAPVVCADEFDSDGVKIHYTVSGKGDPVILIHGLYASAKINWDLPGITKDLAEHYQVIALDNRGHGQSGKPKAEGEYGEKMAEDVVRLMDHLHIAKARIVGYSLGGMIAMKVVTRHPERVTSTVLGGMGWLKEGSALQQFWEMSGGRRMMGVPPACLHGIAKLAITEAEVKAVRVPVVMIVGDRDPCRVLYVDPLRKVRPEWPEYIIQDAGHLNCIGKPDFKTQLNSALGGK